jgi:hypothetical protein
MPALNLVPLKDANKKHDDKPILKKFSKRFSKSARRLNRELSHLFTRKQRPSVLENTRFEHGDTYPPNKLEIIGKKIDTTVSRPHSRYIPSDYTHLNLRDIIHPETEPIDYKNNALSAMNPDNKKYIRQGFNAKKKNALMYPEAYRGDFVAETALSLSRIPRPKNRSHESSKGGRRRKTRRGSSKR